MPSDWLFLLSSFSPILFSLPLSLSLSLFFFPLSRLERWVLMRAFKRERALRRDRDWGNKESLINAEHLGER